MYYEFLLKKEPHIFQQLYTEVGSIVPQIKAHLCLLLLPTSVRIKKLKTEVCLSKILNEQEKENRLLKMNFHARITLPINSSFSSITAPVMVKKHNPENAVS